MKRNFVGFLIFGLFALLCSACFEIKEEVILNKNGSGNYKVSLDLKKSKSIIDEMRSINNGDNPNVTLFQSSRQSFDSMAQELNILDGISNAKPITDDDYTIGLQFDFTDVEALNKATAKGKKVNALYFFEKKNFERVPIKEEKLVDLLNLDEEEHQVTEIHQILSQGKYVFTLKTPDGKIKKSENTLSDISSNKKELYFSIKLSKISDDSAELNQKIKIR